MTDFDLSVIHKPMYSWCVFLLLVRPHMKTLKKKYVNERIAFE